MHSTAAPSQLRRGRPSVSLFILYVTVVVAGNSTTRENPFTPRSYVLRYWRNHISNDLPTPEFLLSKASPLTAAESVVFSELLKQKTLSARLPEFCKKANLFCLPNLNQDVDKHGNDVNFVSYVNKNFTSYGSGRHGAADGFNTYSDGDNFVVDSFRRYSRGSTGHGEEFSAYATDANVVDQSFNTYGATATGGEGKFSSYNGRVNIPNLRFTSYSEGGNGRTQSFTEYSDKASSGDQRFTGYGKNSNGVADVFSSYGNSSNTIGSTFNSYGGGANAANDTFTSYGTDTNVPENTFKNYAADGNSAIESFRNYRDQSNVGDDGFESYGKKSNAVKVEFVNYGHSFNKGTDKFTGYGEDSTTTSTVVGFHKYGVNNAFKEYSKHGINFAGYTNGTSQTAPIRWIEPGKFFREAKLKTNTTMAMPDITDKMPRRSFLPQQISSRIPFSTTKLHELKNIFHGGDSTISNALNECERAPSSGEMKRCVASIEDMVDFAIAVLGHDVVVRTTENTGGANGEVVVGEVRGINGGKVTKSVSCHQSLFPYLLYYCHSVPKVRVYEADLLDPKSMVKINRGVAICHLDSSSWSPGHGAFLALGSGPGKIEVCHWIFENDMTWTTAD